MSTTFFACNEKTCMKNYIPVLSEAVVHNRSCACSITRELKHTNLEFVNMSPKFVAPSVTKQALRKIIKPKIENVIERLPRC